MPVAFTPHLYEIHGNVFYMHCEDESQEHSKTFYKAPKDVKDKLNTVPKCTECGKNMKPHSMFFTEAYSEHYYRKETVDEYYKDADCLIVVGTALATSYAKRMVVDFLNEEKLVIEVNMEPCVEVGRTLQLIGKSEVILPKLFDVYHGIEQKEESKEESKEITKAKIEVKPVKPKAVL